MHLTEAAYGCELTNNAIRIVFPSALFPQAVFAQQPNGSHVHLLTAQGVLYRVQLPHPSEGRPEESVLNSLRGTNGGTAGTSKSSTYLHLDALCARDLYLDLWHSLEIVDVLIASLALEQTHAACPKNDMLFSGG